MRLVSRLGMTAGLLIQFPLIVAKVVAIALLSTANAILATWAD